MKITAIDTCVLTVPTPHPISTEFPNHKLVVAEIVAGCSDTDVIPKPPWCSRKEAYIAGLAGHSPSVQRVSLADKLHNARAILLVDARTRALPSVCRLESTGVRNDRQRGR